MQIIPKIAMRYPMGLERKYAKELRAYVRKEMSIIREYIPVLVSAVEANAIRTDEDEPEDDSDWINALLALLFANIAERTFIQDKVLQIFDQVEKHANQEYDRITRSVFGSVSTLPASYAQDMERMKKLFLDQNLRLINSIDYETREALYYTLAENAVGEVDRATLERHIRDFIRNRTDISEKRATLIGADQVGKLYGQINQYLQRKDGIGEYVWRTMRDSRVRILHRERDGKIFRWDSPPSDGHPGWPIRCRCVADPVFDTEKKSLQPRRNSFIQISEDGIIKPDKVITGHEKIPREFKPNGVIDYVNSSGHTERTFYGSDGIMVRQIHSDNHRNPKKHPYGTHGEHKHDYVWSKDGKKLLQRKVNEWDEQERKENGDLMWWK